MIDADLFLLGSLLLVALLCLEVLNFASRRHPVLRPAGRVVASLWPNQILYSLALVLLWAALVTHISLMVGIDVMGYGFLGVVPFVLLGAINSVVTVALVNRIRFFEEGPAGLRESALRDSATTEE